MKINRLAYGVAFALVIILGQPARASAADIQVLCSNGFKAVFEELAPQFERASGCPTGIS